MCELTELVLPKWNASCSRSFVAAAAFSASEPDSPYEGFAFALAFTSPEDLSDGFPFKRVPVKSLATFNAD